MTDVYKQVLEDFKEWVRTCKTGYGRNEILQKLNLLETQVRKAPPLLPTEQPQPALKEQYVIGYANTKDGEECVLSGLLDTYPDKGDIATGIKLFGAEYAVVEKRYYPAGDYNGFYAIEELDEDDLPFK